MRGGSVRLVDSISQDFLTVPDDSERCVVISTDGHCGADLRDYKPYLESRYRREFDIWADNFRDGWIESDQARSTADASRRSGHASLNWDSEARLRVLEEQGVVAEVLFPNTAPPFSPSGALTAYSPRSAEEYEFRYAGLRAHNRWLADFCAGAVGRRAGLAQVFLDDIDDSIKELRWAKQAGLKGVLLPAPHVQKMVNLYYADYDRLWAVCEELGMVIAIHSAWITEHPRHVGVSALLAGVFEFNFYARRQIGHLIAAGVFERFPSLMVVAAELNDSADIPAWLAELDAIVTHAASCSHQDAFLLEAVRRLKRAPSEYFRSNVFLAGPTDLQRGIAAGTPNLMFGADLPHGEGTAPYTREGLRLVAPRLAPIERQQFLAERARYVFGFDMDLLRGIAARCGPRIEDVTTALVPEERPQSGTGTHCRLFQPRAALR